MTLNHPEVFLLRSPWIGGFKKLLSLADEDLVIACPFVKRFATDCIIAEITRREIRESLRLLLITDLRPESTLAGAMDLDALGELGSKMPGFVLTHLPSTHAKVYIADRKMAVVTSGNLTGPGLSGNVEYGIALAETGVVSEIRSDIEGYAKLGATVPVKDVAVFSGEMQELRKLFQRAEKSVRAQARRMFKQKLEATHLRLLRYRATGKTTHAIFADTIRFLLAKGPIQTEELHPLVQLLQPDLCDDSVDRVIDGVHFGKKWKYYVRNAQQSLKRNGEISFDGSRWHLAPQ
jgi:hypothetical protein